MMLDVFNSDAFHLTNLVQAINTLPYVPTMIRDRGLFAQQGVTTTTVMVEMQGDVLALVPTAPRGAPGKPITTGRRNVRPFSTVHLPQTVQLMADEVQGLRAFGSETEEELATAQLNRKLAIARRNLDLTIEFQRIGAIKGKVIDADGTTVLLNLFTEFGVTQQTLDMALDVDATKVFMKNVTVTRMVEDELGGVTMTGALVLCSSGFFDALVSHPATEESFKYQEAAKLREDNRRGFRLGENTYVEYRGSVGGTNFIEPNCAYAIPEGVPELFTTYYAPAPYMDTVNTQGLPYYASLEFMDHNVGIHVQTQSNPLHLCSRPRAIIKLGKNAAALA